MTEAERNLRKQLEKMRKETEALEQEYFRMKFEKQIQAFCTAMQASDALFDIINDNDLNVEDVKLLAKLLNTSLKKFYKHCEPQLIANREKRSRKNSKHVDLNSYATASKDAVNTDADSHQLNSTHSQHQY